MAIGAYVTLLCVWVLFVAPALRARRGERAALAVAVTLGLLALAYELWMTFVWGPSAAGPIRFEIFFIFWALAAAYTVAALRLWSRGWRRTAAVAGVVTLTASAGMAAAWIDIRGESARLEGLREEGNRLLFEARFRNHDAYARAFGMSDAPSGFPTGNWQAEAAAPFSRLIVNPAGQAHLFFRCGPTECRFGSSGQLHSTHSGEAPDWTVELVMQGVGTRRLAIEAPVGDALEVRIDDSLVRFRRASPPLLGLPDGEALAYLGSFSAAERLREHARVSQLWLWRGDDELLAVAIFRMLLPGRRASFVSPALLGSGTRENGRWRFRWSEAGRKHEALLRLVDGGVEVEIPGEEQRWPPHTVTPQAIFHDDVIELAPLAGAGDWHHWFAVHLEAHFCSAEIPDL